MKIFERIIADLKDAQKKKDSLKLSTLRMAKSSLDYKKLELKKDKLEENEIIAVLKTTVKQRKESIEAFEKAGKNEAAQKEKEELKIIEAYMPASVPKEQIEKVVDEVIKELQITEIKEMGKAMKAAMEKFKGQIVDGKLVSNLVKEKLSPKEEKKDE